MVARLQDMPPGTLGFRATGEITREDYADIFVPELHSAIVTDIAWMAHATKLFAWMIPGEARVFPRAELEQAKSWIAGGDG